MIELLGTELPLLALFTTFGLAVGILFGFFGMGGSFLVTPLLMMLGYRPTVAVGSGMAFVFGTAVIATIKHHDLGQVDYKLGVAMILGTTAGIEVGRIGVVFLEDLGMAGMIISTVYVLLLGGVGVFVTRDALGDSDGDDGGDPHDAEGSLDDFEVPRFAKKVQSVYLPPMINLRGGVSVSLWAILAVAFATGLLSGFLGVGGGFIRMPSMIYSLGIPVPVAVGTDLFEIVFSGGIGSFLYAQSGGVDLGIVVPLLAGSALGARLGSAATEVVDSGDIKIYFGAMLLGGSVAVAVGELGAPLGMPVLETVSTVLIVGAGFLVSAAVVYNALDAARSRATADVVAD
jgi:uncharacterized membrane protein YfcA